MTTSGEAIGTRRRSLVVERFRIITAVETCTDIRREIKMFTDQSSETFRTYVQPGETRQLILSIISIINFVFSRASSFFHMFHQRVQGCPVIQQQDDSPFCHSCKIIQLMQDSDISFSCHGLTKNQYGMKREGYHGLS